VIEAELLSSHGKRTGNQRVDTRGETLKPDQRLTPSTMIRVRDNPTYQHSRARPTTLIPTLIPQEMHPMIHKAKTVLLYIATVTVYMLAVRYTRDDKLGPQARR